MKYKLKEGKSVEDIPRFSALLKFIGGSLSTSSVVELDQVPKAAKEFLTEVASPIASSMKKEVAKKPKGCK